MRKYFDSFGTADDHMLYYKDMMTDRQIDRQAGGQTDRQADESGR